jgi:hypothetical protein
VAGVGEGALELGQQGLEPDPQLQGGLAVAAGVEVGPGAEEEGLAGVEPLAAAENSGDSFLRAQLLLAPAAARGAEADVDRAGVAEAAGCDLLAAAVADQNPLGSLGAQLAVGAGRRSRDSLRVQGPVQQRQSLVDEDVDGVLGLAGLVQPARRLSLIRERGEGADRGRAGQGQGLRLVAEIDPAGPAPAPAGGARRADPLEDEDALRRLGPLGARQVATVGERQRPGEVELDESE